MMYEEDTFDGNEELCCIKMLLQVHSKVCMSRSIYQINIWTIKMSNVLVIVEAQSVSCVLVCKSV